MAKDEKNPYENPWNKYKDDWAKKCHCKECTPDQGNKCKYKELHPSALINQVVPVLTVEEAIEVYRKAKANKVTASEALRKARAKIVELEQQIVDTANEEFRARTTLERAFENEAKNNG